MQSDIVETSSYKNNIFGIMPSDSDQYGIELSDRPTSIDQSNTDSDTSPSSGKWTSFLEHIRKTFACLNVEKRGIERVLPEDRNDSTIMNTAMIWVAANTVVPAFSVGTLGPSVFNLSLYDSFIAIIIFNIVGIIPVAAMACFGPATGLRTMVFCRYSWGYYGASIMAFVNVITTLGWGAVNSVSGAQTLRVVSNDSLSYAVGIVIMAIMSMIVSFVGYRWIHIYQRFSWIPVFISYCIVAGVGAKYYMSSIMLSSNSTSTSRHMEIVNLISFGGTCFGNAISWSSFSSDYNTYFPEDTSSIKIFILTYLGNFLSIIPIELLGASVYMGTYTNEEWRDAYARDNVGGLLGASVSSLGGFGKFLLTIFALSTVSSNILNIYSLSLSTQVISPIFKVIPRFVYTLIGTGIYIFLSILAANKFNDSLVSFADVVSYWFSILIVVVFEEHLIFRRCSFKNYDLNNWNDRKSFPIRLSAILSGLIGIVGIILGMSQTWFIGPIAKAIAGNTDAGGADLGFEFGFILTAITFPIFRLIELHFEKR